MRSALTLSWPSPRAYLSVIGYTLLGAVIGFGMNGLVLLVSGIDFLSSSIHYYIPYWPDNLFSTSTYRYVADYGLIYLLGLIYITANQLSERRHATQWGLLGGVLSLMIAYSGLFVKPVLDFLATLDTSAIDTDMLYMLQLFLPGIGLAGACLYFCANLITRQRHSALVGLLAPIFVVSLLLMLSAAQELISAPQIFFQNTGDNNELGTAMLFVYLIPLVLSTGIILGWQLKYPLHWLVLILFVELFVMGITPILAYIGEHMGWFIFLMPFTMWGATIFGLAAWQSATERLAPEGG